MISKNLLLVVTLLAVLVSGCKLFPDDEPTSEETVNNLEYVDDISCIWEVGGVPLCQDSSSNYYAEACAKYGETPYEGDCWDNGFQEYCADYNTLDPSVVGSVYTQTINNCATALESAGCEYVDVNTDYDLVQCLNSDSRQITCEETVLWEDFGYSYNCRENRIAKFCNDTPEQVTADNTGEAGQRTGSISESEDCASIGYPYYCAEYDYYTSQPDCVNDTPPSGGDDSSDESTTESCGLHSTFGGGTVKSGEELGVGSVNTSTGCRFTKVATESGCKADVSYVSCANYGQSAGCYSGTQNCGDYGFYD